MGEISEPGAALSWVVGGIFLFFRVLLAHVFDWMRLPAGGRISNASQPVGGTGPLFPKYLRMVTAVILLATAVLFFLPAGREARTTVSASWREMGDSPSDRREFEKLAARAEKEQDARELAFVALSDPDPGRASQFTDRAVALNSALTWIYASRIPRSEAAMTNKQWLKRLQSSDPDNAFVRSALMSDDNWITEMDRAFRAPRYDSYFERRRELMREGWRKRPNLSPALAGYGLWSHSLPDGFQITTYAEDSSSTSGWYGGEGGSSSGDSCGRHRIWKTD